MEGLSYLITALNYIYCFLKVNWEQRLGRDKGGILIVYSVTLGTGDALWSLILKRALGSPVIDA